MNRKCFLMIRSLIAFTGFLVINSVFPNNLSASPVMNEAGYRIELVKNGLQLANGVSVGPTGDIYVAGYDASGAGKILKINNNTKDLTVFAQDGLTFLTDITFDNLGNIYVGSGDGAPRYIYKVIGNASYEFVATGSYTVGIRFSPKDGLLYLGNSGDGTITRLPVPGIPQVFLSGYGGGLHGITFDEAGNLYFVQHGTGQIWKSTPDGLSVSLLGTYSPLGPSWVAVDKNGNVFVSDSLTANIWKISNGTSTLFASGFTGKSNPPYIGPNGLAFDDIGILYVADADNLWKIIESVPPTVSLTSPANQATDVSINTAVSVTFSELMDTSSITAGTFIITGGGGSVSGPISFATFSGKTVATLTPSSALAYGTTYTATVTIGVEDPAENPMVQNYVWTFTTGVAPDTTPPTVISTVPDADTSGVSIATPITVTFSEAMAASSFMPTSFILTGGGSSVPCTVIVNGATATYTPSTQLEYNTVYTATVTTLVEDLAGNAMAANNTWSFTTEKAPSSGGGGGGCSVSPGSTSGVQFFILMVLVLLCPYFTLSIRKIIKNIKAREV